MNFEHPLFILKAITLSKVGAKYNPKGYNNENPKLRNESFIAII